MSKDLFRDNTVPFQDIFPPNVNDLPYSEIEKLLTEGCTKLFDPESLLVLAFKAVATNIQLPTSFMSLKPNGDATSSPTTNTNMTSYSNSTSIISPLTIAYKLPFYLKQRLSLNLISFLNPKILDDLQTIRYDKTLYKYFSNHDIGFSYNLIELNCSGVDLGINDIQAITLLLCSNKSLKKLQFNSNHLKANTINLLMRNIGLNLWPSLTVLDLSFNILDIAAIKYIIEGKLINNIDYTVYILFSDVVQY